MSTNQRGFSFIEVLIVVVVVVASGFIGWSVLGKSKRTNSDQVQQNSPIKNANKASAQEPDIELQNIGLQNIEDIDVNMQAVSEYSSKGLKGFYVFGDKLTGNRLNPNFEYASLRSGTQVVSAINGVVGFIKEQSDSKDLEVIIQPKEGSVWSVGYDHLTHVKVKKGDKIKAGDVIGEPSVQNNGLLRFELQVNKDKNGQTIHHCPSTLLANGVKEKYINELASMQKKWESSTKLELYDVVAQNPVGCLKPTLTPEDAEGR